MILIIIGCCMGLAFTLVNLLILWIMVKLYTEILKNESITRRIGEERR